MNNLYNGGHVLSSAFSAVVMRAKFFLLSLLLMSAVVPAHAILLTLADRPIYAGGNIPPLVMIDLSKDHQLYFKAYNDYSDLDGNGSLETTYTHSIDYYGYFDSYKCYDYSSANHRFEPQSITTDKYCAGNWSGNFLNWSSMSRMDAVRKLLYGGMRSTDTSNVLASDGLTVTTVGVTVLERSYQPTDAHSWAKFYNGSDLGRLTPATLADVLTGITLCNVTPGADSGNDQYSQTNTRAPLIRAVRGNYALWASNERWQCTWSGTLGASNGNNSAQSGLFAASSSPVKATVAFGTGSDGTSASTGEYVARVQACASAALLGKEKCLQYPNKTYKPIGLLQTYGATGLMKFGLLTGSYTKNISGGVLRRNVTDFGREIVATNGTFKPSSATGNDGKGIVYNLNKMRIYGYNHNKDSGGYVDNNANSEACNYQMTGIVMTGGGTGQGDAAPQGNCSTWGNPISEIFLESIRYFAGLQPTAAFTYTAGTTKDDKLGLTIEDWVDPLNAQNYCSPLNTLVFNPAISSYDNDQMSMTDITGATGSTVEQLTDIVGAGEGVTSGTSWLIGSNGTATDNGICSSKALTGLSAALGICPETPTQKGTYLIAGAAYYAKTNRIRQSGAVLAAVPATDKKSLKVTTYGIQLASNTPSITVNIGTRQVKIIPAYRVNAGNKGVYSSGTIVDFKVVDQTATTGRFYVNWEDSTQGGDFDQDVWGMLSYEVNTAGTEIKITTKIVDAASANGQGFGYVISGTNKDGAHFHSGAYNFSFTDATNITVTPTTNVNASGGCNSCVPGNAATTATYTVTGATGGELEDPLWYASKWGGFTEPATGGTNKPDDPSKWDTRRADGTAGADGVPDNYFFVANPAALESAMEKAFISILSTSSASSVATNSTSLNTGAKIYQARFNANDWSGQLFSYPISTAGIISSTPDWDAGQKINTIGATNRVILTYDNSTATTAGIPFRWTNLNINDQAALKFGATDTRAEERLNWIRGDRSQEGSASNQLRKRLTTVLGDIVNSNPQYVGAPGSGYDDTDYFSFISARASRTPMLYMGANDGMVHGFSAIDGVEKLAFIPSPVIPNLSKLTAQAYSHQYYVDATPTVGDAKTGASEWKTLLVGGLGGGGQGIYALDVTNPGTVAADGVTTTNAFSETSANSIVQWEFTDKNDLDLGYTYGRPSIVKMANGKWAAVFGNGYNNSLSDSSTSTTGKAALFILFLDRAAGSKTWTLGTHYIKIVVPAGSVGTPNGLSTPSAIDINSDGVIDYIYAGDLEGNMWKFDVTSATPASWKIAYGTASSPLPLYTAKSAGAVAQPITSAPDIIRNPAGGFVVLFGTGRYLQSSDASDTSTQSFYGIWDENLSTTPTATRSNLTEQSILREVTEGTLNFRITSDVIVPYTSSMRGWFMDLKLPSPATATGERVVYDPTIRDGRISFSTLIPSVNICAVGGTSWLMELDAVSGRRLSFSPFDVNGDGFINALDLRPLVAGGTALVSVGGRSNPGMGITPAPTIIEGEGRTFIRVESGSSGLTDGSLGLGVGSSGRLSWREIMQ